MAALATAAVLWRPALAAEATASATLVVPIVLSCTGAYGSFFTSELTITNRGTTPAAVEMRYTAAFGGGDGTCTETLLAGEQKVIPDAIAYLCERGLPLPATGNRGGTLEVGFIGLSSSDAAAVTVKTATATAAPQPVGTAGLAYPAVPPASGITTAATLYGLRATPQDRSNVAIFNPTSDAVTVKVTACAGDGSGASAVKAELEVPGLGWTQMSGIFDGTGIESGWVSLERTAGTGAFGAYGVVNCNGTNDGSYLPPTAGGATGSRVTVPVLVETTSGFLSELVLTNRSSSEATLTLQYVESLTPALGAGGTVTLTLRAREQLILPDALEILRGKGLAIGARGAGDYAGALRVSVQGAALSEVFAGARTASLCPSGGQFGLFTPGVYEGQEASTEAFLYGLRADETNRTNVAVLNAGADGSDAVTLDLQAFDGDAGGLSRGDAERVTLEPGGWFQASGFLSSKGVKNGWVRVTRLSGTAPWIAYAVVNDGGQPDQRTGDGAYVPMAASAAPSRWEISTLPETWVAKFSLDYDPKGRPAIAYSISKNSAWTEYGAKLAVWDSEASAWTLQPVSSDAYAIDLAFDPADGKPSVSYSSNSGKMSVNFAHWTGSVWEARTIEESLGIIERTQLAYAPDGTPSIAYRSTGALPGVRFAKWNGTAWVIQRVDQGWPLDCCSLAYDPQGNAAIAYSTFVENPDTQDLKLARWNGSTWQTEVIERGRNKGSISLAFDPAGRPAIVYSSPARFVRWDGSGWVAEEIAAAPYQRGTLAYDQSGVPVVGLANPLSNIELATRESGGGWRLEVVESTPNTGTSVLRFDSSGRPSLCYARSIQGSTESVARRGAADMIRTLAFAHRVR